MDSLFTPKFSETQEKMAQPQQRVRRSSVRRALDLVGDRATLLILEGCFLGVTRFNELQQRTCLSRTVLSGRLRQLVTADCLSQRPYQARPLRHDYHLRTKGRALYCVALMLLRWEQRWGEKEGKMRVTLRHQNCGAVCTPVLVSECCGQEIRAREVSYADGPGAGWELRTPPPRRRARESSLQSRNSLSLWDSAVRHLGDRITAEVVATAYFRLRRFDEIQQATGIATNLVADRLRKLVQERFLTRKLYQQRPSRYEYRLTEKGLDFYPVIVALAHWADRWLPNPEGVPLFLFHRPCEATLRPRVVCSKCAHPLEADNVEFEVNWGTRDSE